MTSKPTASGGAGGSECSRAAELQAALVDQTAPGAGDHRQVQKSAPGVIEERPLTHGVIEQPVLLDRDHRDVVAGTPAPISERRDTVGFPIRSYPPIRIRHPPVGFPIRRCRLQVNRRYAKAVV
jgi:hypothetical protein